MAFRSEMRSTFLETIRAVGYVMATVMLMSFLAKMALAHDCLGQASEVASYPSDVDVRLEIPADLRAGGAFQLSWASQPRSSTKLPVFVVVSIMGEVRIEAKPLRSAPIARRKNGQGQSFITESDGPSEFAGVMVLPPSARGPLGLSFGAGTSRVLLPLHQPGARLTGSVGVRIFQAGMLNVSARLITPTGCGDLTLAILDERSVLVQPGSPEIVVQDPFELDLPEKVLVSNSGRYRLHIFSGYYRVFDVASGAKLIDRAGSVATFSPTARFIVAQIAGGRGYEIIDLVSRDVIHIARGPFIGWMHSDAYFLDGTHQWAELEIRPSLVSRSASIGVGGGCHVCSSYDSIPMDLDVDNGIVVFFDVGGEAGDVYELSSGHTACCTEKRHDSIDPEGAARLRSVVQSTYAISPVAWLETQHTGWHAADGLALTHGDVPTDPDDQKVTHPVAQPPTPLADISLPTSDRAEWRTRDALLIRAATALPGEKQIALDGNTSDKRERVLRELSRFGIIASLPVIREAMSFPHRPDNNEKADLMTKLQILQDRLANEVPAVRPLLATKDGGHLMQDKNWLPHVLGLWRWNLDAKPLWLMQLFDTQGTGMFGHGVIILLRADHADGQVIDLSAFLEDLWTGEYSSDEQTRFISELFADRYLLVASKINRTIAVLDLALNGKPLLISNVPQIDLLQDIFVSTDLNYVVQVNRDGQFFLHKMRDGSQALAGRLVDNEIIIYTAEGYYWSSYEGAHFVHLRFAGLSGLFSFHQFASVSDRPDLIEAKLMGAEILNTPALTSPPTLETKLEVAQSGEGPIVDVRSGSLVGLARLRFYYDGQLVRETEMSGHEFAANVSLPPSINAQWLTVLAVDTRGFLSHAQTHRITGSRGPAGRLYSVVVGVDDYSEPNLKLQYAKSDALKLAQAMKATTGRYYAQEAQTVLLDSNATANAIVSALTRAVDDASVHDTIVFSFAGHGIKGPDDRYYLATAGHRSDNVSGTSLSWQRVASILGRSRARVLILLDSCHAALSGAEGFSDHDDAVTSLMQSARGPVLVLAASKGRESSYEGPKWRGGVFTKALVDVIHHDWRAADRDGNGVLELSELYVGVRSIVFRETEGKQTPWLVRRDMIGDFAVF